MFLLFQVLAPHFITCWLFCLLGGSSCHVPFSFSLPPPPGSTSTHRLHTHVHARRACTLRPCSFSFSYSHPLPEALFTQLTHTLLQVLFWPLFTSSRQPSVIRSGLFPQHHMHPTITMPRPCVIMLSIRLTSVFPPLCYKLLKVPLCLTGPFTGIQ